MIPPLATLRTRGLALLGAVSMYRLVLYCLAALAVIAFVLSFFGVLVPSPWELLVTVAVLVVACVGVDWVAHRILRRPPHLESSLATAGILVFVLRPEIEPIALGGPALAALLATLSKYVVAWRGRHILNPAAFGAGIVTLTPLASSAWWVGTPLLAIPVAVLGMLVLWRTEKVRVVLVFVLVALCAAVIRQSVQAEAAGLQFEVWQAASLALLQSPILFLGAFMLSEPLTLPPRRWQQFTVAAFVGVLVGWPIIIGQVSLGQERALLLGNLLAFAFATRTAVRLVLVARDRVTPSIVGLRFRAQGRMRFTAGQYLQLEVPHHSADARGTRREFSIVSAPSDLPEVRLAYRDSGHKPVSSFKRALAEVQPGTALPVTGVWGDFVLPPGDAPVLLVAAGVGVTPFVSQLREAAHGETDRDIVLVYVASEASELAFRDDLVHAGVEVIVFTRDAPADLPDNWQWASGVRLDAEGLVRVVPDLAARHAFISGPPGLIADLAPALQKARSLTTDAFAGY